MKTIKEHLPREFSLYLYGDQHQSKYALCGNSKNPIVINPWRDNDMSEEVICKTCRKIACEDCFGTGLMGGGNVGIICSCKWGSLYELKNDGFKELT